MNIQISVQIDFLMGHLQEDEDFDGFTDDH
jgi:hypothetical protein